MNDPKPNPFASLLQSRKFWLLVLDTVTSLAVFFVGKYYSVALDDLKFLIGALQPVFVTIIGAIAYEDAHGPIQIESAGVELEVE